MSRVSEAESTAIRIIYERDGELSACMELRRLFPGITDYAKGATGSPGDCVVEATSQANELDMKQNEHGRILAAAARKHLKPLKCKRKGESRVWLLDHGYWVVLIEFQPSAWSKGSYLSVGASWLWTPAGPLGFHYGGRVGNLFISYESQEQFEPEADRLAARAAEEVRKLNDECSSLDKIAAILLGKAAKGGFGHPIFHAGIAAGLVGQLDNARHSFQTVEEKYREGELRLAAITLGKLLESPFHYIHAVEELIREQRIHNKLPELLSGLPC